MYPIRLLSVLGIILALNPSLGSIAAEPPTTPKNETALALETRVTPRATFHIDPTLADRVDPLVERIITQLQQHDQTNATTDFTPDQRDQYIDSITRLLGLEPTAERLALQRKVFDQFSRGPDIRLAPSGTLEITVVDYENAMNHLRSGGSLPNTAYDPEQDTASIRFDFVGMSTDSPMIIDHMVVSVRPDKPIEQAADTWFSLQSSARQTPLIALALLEVAEV